MVVQLMLTAYPAAVSLDFPVRRFDPVLVEAHGPGFSVLSLLEFLSASETYHFDGWAVAILEPVGTEEAAVASVLSLDPHRQMQVVVVDLHGLRNPALCA
ncbi:hypothetical protein PENARI_c008G06353 [Penicillium arizonense]|uniref:Uncharacterized protein n=1 Tax=Penicillium arizonense TaxID=1835702 RepID=A0A1F5LJ98_PENAI|nr:hypothetical protein PENARI_c008G06353 [Penicillium arizonense]OGE53288.1 hypothetical protein PENARI_c008G06353 [Penicillium arizonense]